MYKMSLFQHDNAPAHAPVVVVAKLHTIRFDVLPYALHSPDLAFHDYFFFPNLKKWLGAVLN